jgi:DNA processing protein
MLDRKAQELAWLTLLHTPSISTATVRAALAECPDVCALIRHSPHTLRALGFSNDAAHCLAHGPSAEAMADQDWMLASGTWLLPLGHANYPPQLAALPDAPLALFVQGEVALLGKPQLAIVGSRTPTAAGQRIARQMTQPLCAAGFVITSGLARGIDAAAHSAALDAGGCTVAVVGTGLDQCYPAANRSLLARIREACAVVSEFLPGTPPRAQHFPRRNRIISGLSQGVVVIEAAAGSGSLITAQKALDQGREVFAVPGSPLNPLAAGCLALIRAGAHLARDATDILSEISISPSVSPGENIHPNQYLDGPSQAIATTGRLDKEYEMLLDALGFEPACVDDLVDRTGLAPGSVASMMLILELDGRVELRPGALYHRVG